MRVLILAAFLFSALGLFAQEEENELIQFSGVVVGSDSLGTLPYTSIIIKNSRRGTISDAYGFFSLVAEKNDTIVFTSVGFKGSEFVIPDSLASSRYSLIQVMSSDTILLQETVVYPWPTKDQFRDAFLSLRVPDDEYARIQANLARAEMKERYRDMAMDGSMNHKYAMQQYTSRLYYAGQAPPNHLLNPLAWAKFIEAWKNGDFKKKDK